jgi:hypothetical protein
MHALGHEDEGIQVKLVAGRGLVDGFGEPPPPEVGIRR